MKSQETQQSVNSLCVVIVWVYGLVGILLSNENRQRDADGLIYVPLCSDIRLYSRGQCSIYNAWQGQDSFLIINANVHIIAYVRRIRPGLFECTYDVTAQS